MTKIRSAITCWLPFIVLGPLALAQPSINPEGVVNASSGLPRLAPNVIFVIYGKNLGPAAIATAAAPDYPPELSGTSITFTPLSSGATINARVYYTLDRQVAGLLPSSTSPGTYAVRVAYNGQTSAPQNVEVYERSFGIATANGVGTEVAQATISEVNGGLSLTRFTSSGGSGPYVHSPAHGGDTITVYGTGGGADLANDTGGSSGDQTAAGYFLIVAGDATIRPTYAGTVVGYPGLWIAKFTLPRDIAPNCFADLYVYTDVGHEYSNLALLPIAAAGQSSCSDPILNQAQLARLDSGGSIVGGEFAVTKTTTTITSSSFGQTTTTIATKETATGGFGRYTPSAFGAIRWRGYRYLPIGPCYGFYDLLGIALAPASTVPFAFPDASPFAFLNAGPSLPFTGPGVAANSSLSAATTGLFSTLYNFALPAGTLGAGTYTLTGNGGPEVSTFSASVTFPPAFSVTDWDSIKTINRNQPLTINWTGGGTGMVTVVLSSSTRSGPLPSYARNYRVSCQVPANQRSVTVPVALLSLLPAVGIDSSTGDSSSLWVSVGPNPGEGAFTANLGGGGQTDYATFGYSVGVARNPVIQ